MSGVDTRPVPVNILAWPKVRDLITQQKFIYVSLYFNPDTTACGCYLLSVDRLAADLSMTAASLDDAIEEFGRRQLVLRDKATGEIFVKDWFRWHRYATPAAKGALWSSIEKIQSPQLKSVAKNTYESIPSPGKGKVKDKEKASSYEEGGAGPLRPGWWATHKSIEEAGRLVGVSARSGESWDELRQRIVARANQGASHAR